MLDNMENTKDSLGAIKLAENIAHDMLESIFVYGNTKSKDGGSLHVNIDDLKNAGKDKLSKDMYGFIQKLKNIRSHLTTAGNSCEKLLANNEKLSPYSDICDVVDKQMSEWRKVIIGDGSFTPKMADQSSATQDDIAKQLFFIGTRSTAECSSCKKVTGERDVVCCKACHNYFHGNCPESTSDNKIGTKTLITNFTSNSTPNNFTWSCGICITHIEQQISSSVQSTATTLGEAVNRLTSQMDDMQTNIDSKLSKVQSNIPTGVWQDKPRLSNMKSSLLIRPDKNGHPVELPAIRDIAVKNGIQVSKTMVTNSGDTYINLPNASCRDKLTPLLQSSSVAEPDQIVNLKSKLPTITILGIQETVTKESALEIILSQNTSIDELVKNGDQLTVLFVKQPTEHTRTCSIVARVTPKIRDEIRRLGNKLYLGLSNHQVKDRFYVKRCNKCQKYHHYENACQNSQCCGYCRSAQHRSRDCPSKNSPPSGHICCNCEASGKDETVYKGHNTMWYRCPTYQQEQDKLKRSINYKYPDQSPLNSW